jgi:acyl carrier protein
MSMQQTLKEYISKDIMKGRSDQLNTHDDLLASGILDSLGILQLVAFLEEELDIRVPDEDVVYENFHSIDALSDYLSAYQQKAA